MTKQRQFCIAYAIQERRGELPALSLFFSSKWVHHTIAFQYSEDLVAYCIDVLATNFQDIDDHTEDFIPVTTFT